MSSTQQTNKTTAVVGNVAQWTEDRTSASTAVRGFARKIFPSHWSFMLGEVALYSFVILVLTGTFLTFWFKPAMGEVIYNGPWTPLRGVTISEAYQSTLEISFEIRGGLFIRQMHHWAALLFMAGLSIHALRVFFTGAFRKPRELNWVIGIVLSMVGLGAGFTGYSLPDDLLSGNGLRIIDGLLKSIPLIGTYISFFLFGGEFPGVDIVSRLYSLHIMILPAVLIALIGAHMMFLVIHKHTHWPGPGHTQKNVVGEPVLPSFAAKAGGFFFMIFAVTAFISSIFTTNPIWNYGPYDPSPVSAGTQPDWYVGWADGILRIMPGWMEFYIFGYPISLNVNIAIIIMMAFWGIAMVWPWIEAWLLKDKREHHILDRPRNAPTRTAIGVAAAVWYAVMWAGASGDLVAVFFHMSLNDMIYIFRILFIVGPFIAFYLTRRICISLQRKDRELVLHGHESGQIIRLPHGEFQERHVPLTPHQSWTLTAFESPQVIPAQPGADGKVSGLERVRASMAKYFYEERVTPVTKAELDAAHAEHHSAVEGDDHEDSAGLEK